MKIVSNLELNGNQVVNFRLDNNKEGYEPSASASGQIWFNNAQDIIQYINSKGQIVDLLDENNLSEMSNVLPKFDFQQIPFNNDINLAIQQGIYSSASAEEIINLPPNFNINSSVTLIVFLDNNNTLVQLLFDTLLNKIWLRSITIRNQEYTFLNWIAFSLEGHIHSELPNLIITDTTPSLSVETGALLVEGGVGIKGNITASGISGAVWNDYAEYRQTIYTNKISAGFCVVEDGKGKVRLSERRLEKVPMIISDTFGFSIGKINELDAPIAVSGRVLAYTDKDVKCFKLGDWVCSGKDGRISKMNLFERIFFSDRRVGIVSAIPQEHYWGTGNVDTTNRIWIKI